MVNYNKNWIFFSILFSTILIDLFIKKIVFMFKPDINILPFFSLKYVENRGAGFGIFQGQQIFLILISVAFLITIFYYYKKIPENLLLIISLALASGGAIGNLCDRVFRGFVIDYLDFFINNLHWPTFNLADVFLVSGAIMFIIYNYVYEDEIKEKIKKS